MQPDSNDYRGVWKLAQVSKADTGSDNMVRNVMIRYKQQGPGHEYKGVQDTFVPRSHIGAQVFTRFTKTF